MTINVTQTLCAHGPHITEMPTTTLSGRTNTSTLCGSLQTAQVTFTLPPWVAARPLLYSGYVTFTPEGKAPANPANSAARRVRTAAAVRSRLQQLQDDGALSAPDWEEQLDAFEEPSSPVDVAPPLQDDDQALALTEPPPAVRLVLPYQGCVGYSGSLPVTMASTWRLNTLCYAPGAVNVLTDAVINPATNVMSGGCTAISSSRMAAPPLLVPLTQLRQYPCALSLVLAPVLPVRR